MITESEEKLQPFSSNTDELAIALAEEQKVSRTLRRQIRRLQTALASERDILQDLLTHLNASRWMRWGRRIGLTKLDAVLAKLTASRTSMDVTLNVDLPAPLTPEPRANAQLAVGDRPLTPPFSMEAAVAHLAKRGFQPCHVLDIGAFKGYWSEMAHAFFPQAHFYMIEPQAANEPRLQELCQTSDHFQYLLCAAGDREEECLLNVAADLASSSLLSFNRPPQPQDHPVAVRKIDNLLAEALIPSPNLVKIDVQGYELKVLEGGQSLFDSAEVFILEVSLFEFMPKQPIFHEIIHYMAIRNYFLFDIAGFLHRPYEEDLGQLDLVFVKENSPLRASNRWM